MAWTVSGGVVGLTDLRCRRITNRWIQRRLRVGWLEVRGGECTDGCRVLAREDRGHRVVRDRGLGMMVDDDETIGIGESKSVRCRRRGYQDPVGGARRCRERDRGQTKLWPEMCHDDVTQARCHERWVARQRTCDTPSGSDGKDCKGCMLASGRDDGRFGDTYLLSATFVALIDEPFVTAECLPEYEPNEDEQYC